MLSGCGFFHSFLKCPFHKRLPQRGVCLLFYLWVGGGRQSSPMGQMCSQNCLLLLTVSDSSALTCVALWGRDCSEPCCPSEVTSLKYAWMNRRIDGFLIIVFSSAVYCHFVVTGFHGTEESKTLGPQIKCAITELSLQPFLLFCFE